MQDKFEINKDHYSTDQSILIYAENKFREKALQHLESCLYINSMTSFSIIKNSLNYQKNIFDNLY